MSWLAVAIGGAIGSVVRYALALWANQGTWPYGTWLVNVIGSFCIGLLFTYGKQQQWMSTELYLFFTVGMMGGFTTFSTFSMETVTMLHNGETAKALLYISLSLACALLATAFGWWLGTRMLRSWT